MKKLRKQDSETLDTLLLEKSFQDLTVEEKAFVLMQVDSREEYEQLQEVMQSVQDLANEEEMIQPKAATKAALLDQFKRQGGQGKVVRMAASPFVRYTAVAACLVLFAFTLSQVLQVNQGTPKAKGIAMTVEQSPSPVVTDMGFATSDANNGFVELEESDPAETDLVASNTNDPNTGGVDDFNSSGVTTTIGSSSHVPVITAAVAPGTFADDTEIQVENARSLEDDPILMDVLFTAL